MLGQYFTRYFTAANSIMLSGGSVGMILAPFLTDGLINHYGWRGAMLVLAAISAHLIAMGATLRPIRRKVTRSQDAAATSTNNVYSMAVNIQRILRNLVFNLPYMLMTLISLLLGIVLFAPNIHIIERAREANIPRSQAAMLPTIIGIGNLLGRLSGFIFDMTPVTSVLSRDAANVAASVISTVTFFVNPQCNTFESQALYCFVFGFVQGAIIVFSFVLAQELIPDDHRAIGVGFVALCLYSGYTIGIILVGKFSIICDTIWSMEYKVGKWETERHAKIERKKQRNI